MLRFLFIQILLIQFLCSFGQASFYEPIQHKAFSKIAFSNTNPNKKNIIVHVIPAICKRCEGTINPTIDALKAIDSNLIFTFIVTGKNTEELKSYINDVAKFKYNKLIFDTSETIHSYVTNYADGNKVPIYYKVDRNGWIENWLVSLGIDLQKKKVLEDFLLTMKYVYVENIKIDTVQIPFPYNNNYSLKLTNKNSSLKNVSSIITFLNDSCFAYVDEIANSIIIVNGNKITSHNKSIIEVRGIVDPEINEQVYSYLKDLYIFHTIYLKLEFIDSKNLLLYTSLPKIILNKINDEYNIDYYNQACVLSNNIISNNTILIDSGFADIDSLSVLHQYGVRYNGGFLFPVQKGWPVRGNNPISEYPFSENPMTDEFYKNTPLVYNYDRYNGKELLFSLEDVYKITRSGYLFTSPKMYVTDKNKLFLNTGYGEYSYRINLSDKSKIDTFYTPINHLIFDDTSNNFKYTINTADGYNFKFIKTKNDTNPIKHLYEMSKHFQLGCVQLIANDDFIYFLLKDKSDNYYIRKYSIKKQWFVGSVKLPKTINGKHTLSNYTMRLTDNDVYLYGLFNSQDTYQLYKVIPKF